MIRSAGKKDCMDLAVLSLHVWLHTYATKGIRSQISQYAIATFTEQHFSELLDQPSIDIRVFEQEGHLIGFVVVDLESRFKQSLDYGYEVVTLYVSPHFQGSGVGRKLLKEIKGLHGLPYWLSTWVNNHEALNFYAKLGFNIVGELNFDLEGELHSNHVLVNQA